MSEELDVVKKAQQEYERQAERKRRRERAVIYSTGALMLVVVGVGGYYVLKSGGAGPDDCSNPKNVNTPYCQNRGVEEAKDWKGVTQGGGQSFSLSN